MNSMGNPKQQASQGAAQVLALPAQCRLGEAAALKASLLQASAASALLLDGSGVERVDTAALQVLAAFARDLAASGGKPAWRGASDSLREACGLLGLETLLNLPAKQPA
jgi:anti-anti-sigma regulatory factor